MSYTKLTHAQLKSVPLPDNKFNLSLLLPETRTIDCVPGFETVEWCANEDHRRAAAIRALSVREVRRWLFYSQEPREVADALGQAAQSWTPDHSFASALHRRQRRLRLLGAVLARPSGDGQSWGEELRTCCSTSKFSRH